MPAIIQPILDSGMLEAGEAMTLRRWFYGDGMIHQEDAEALFRVNARLAGRCADFNALFVEVLSDYVVYQTMPTGRVTSRAGRVADGARWVERVRRSRRRPSLRSSSRSWRRRTRSLPISPPSPWRR